MSDRLTRPSQTNQTVKPTPGALVDSAAEVSPSARRPYTAPCVLSREPLEAMANVCSPPFGKADLTCEGPLTS